jgi:hypothetical protein
MPRYAPAAVAALPISHTRVGGPVSVDGAGANLTPEELAAVPGLAEGR